MATGDFNVFYELFGQNEYAVSLPTSSLMKTWGERIPNDIARLKGARFIYATEGDNLSRLDEGLIKRLTGNDVIPARFMRGEFFDFRMTGTIFFSTNHRPQIRGSDDAIWDRIKEVPFKVRIADEKRDPNLLEKLLTELPGIFNWVLDGCLEYQQKGFAEPEEVKDATHKYRIEMDILQGFIDEKCIVSQHARVRASKLYDAYVSWCSEVGEKSVGSRDFSERLIEKGFIKDRDNAGRLYVGIGLYSNN